MIEFIAGFLLGLVSGLVLFVWAVKIVKGVYGDNLD